VGHHVPSELGVADMYKGNLLNAAFRSRLDAFIEARPQIKYWFFGHTHFDFNFWIGETHLACNPRGYVGYEDRTEWFQLKYFEV
jgi:hypothetical protein